MGHICNMLKDFLENCNGIGEYYETAEGLHITLSTYRCGVSYTLKWCPFCFGEQLGEKEG